jgi:ribosomal-protein-alanine N-acetyltransferase
MILQTKRLPILETERLRLDLLTAADAGCVFPLMDDPEVMAYWDSPEVDDPDVVAGIVQHQVEEMAMGRAVYWAMRTLDAAQFVGCCDLSEIDQRHRRAELRFMLGPDAWGQAYALEAMRAVVAYAGGAGLRRLTARSQLGNRRFEGVLQTLGFKEEGLLRGHILKDGERRDCQLYGLLL